MEKHRLIIFGEEKDYTAETTYYDIAQEYQERVPERILLVNHANRLRELHHTVSEDGELSFITAKDPAGRSAYWRTLTLLMVKAVGDVAGKGQDCRVTVHYTVSKGLYCTLNRKKIVTEEFLGLVTARMRELRDRSLRIQKRTVSTIKARRLFDAQKMPDKSRLFQYRLSSRTNVYELEDYLDYYYGYMLYDTSYLEHFSLIRYEDGFVLCSPLGEEDSTLTAFNPVDKLFHVQHKALEWGEELGIRTVAELNDRIVSGSTKELVLTQEAYHERNIAAIAQEIAGNPRHKLVMIAGPSSSGKTTFSHRLSTQLSIYGLNPHPIAMDNYFVNREDTPRDEDGNYDYECLEAIDVLQFNEDMGALLAGEAVDMPIYNFITGRREYKGNIKKLGSRDILVIEGIHGLNDQLSRGLPRDNQYRIYISALTQLNLDEHNRISTTDGRLIRRIVRDARTRGVSARETIARWPSVRRGEEKHIFPHQQRADTMFNSALIYELAVLKIYAQPLLFGIGRECPEYVEAKRLLKFLDYFVPLAPDAILQNSLLREFIGGSCFDV